MLETISFDQLADKIDVPRHIIHLWTKKFPLLNPQRSATGKVGFKYRDIALAQGLKYFLIIEKQSIKDVQALLNERGVSHVINVGKDYQDKIAKIDDVASFDTPELYIKEGKNSSLAKRTMDSLNTIFSKETIKKPKIQADPIVEASKKITKQDSFDNKTKTIIEDNAPEAVQQEAQKDYKKPTTDNFEDNWRSIMEKEGKVPSVDDARSQSMSQNDEMLLSDIWMIDDEIDLFDNEASNYTPELDNISSISQKHIKEIPAANPLPEKDMLVSVTNAKKVTLAPEQEEKIKHLIAKLDIMHDEMVSASTVITNTLKAFGYSGFENAYNKFDQKSVY